MASDNTYCRTVGYCPIKHNWTDVRDRMVLTFVDNMLKVEYDSDLAMFPALAILFKCLILIAKESVTLARNSHLYYTICRLIRLYYIRHQ